MTFKLCKALIAAGRMSKEELLEKFDVFFAAGRLAADQYATLVEMLGE